jgi:hypothetical protein
LVSLPRDREVWRADHAPVLRLEPAQFISAIRVSMYPVVMAGAKEHYAKQVIATPAMRVMRL